MQAFLYVTPPAVCLLIVFAAGELVVRNVRRQNVWLALIYVAYALVLTRAFLLFSGWMRAAPILYESTLPANFWIGPLIYFYIRAAVDGPGVAGRRLLPNPRGIAPHFVPGLLAFLLVIPNAPQPAAATIERYVDAMRWIDGAAGGAPRDLYTLLTPLALAHVAVYLGLIVRSMLLLLNLEHLRRQATVRAFLAMTALSLVSTAIAFAGIATATRAMVEFAIGLLALVVPLMYLLQKRYPDLFEVLEGLLRAERAKRAPYPQSHLAGVDLEQLGRRLARLMDQERVYRREDLSMPVLAQLMETTPHRLSEYLNSVESVSFSDFVNQRRVRAARELLVSRPDQTVLSIAYEVGFNSKSAFNKAFARFTGESPTRFRKEGGSLNS
jgi:AraC-like DNA-binding protein